MSKRLIHRLLVILFRMLAAGLAGAAILAGFALWFLSRGPVSLDPIAPYVAGMLSEGALTATVDHTLLSFGDHGHIMILARGVHLRQAGSANLTLDEMALEFSFRPLLSGVIAPTRIALRRPDLQVLRDPDGSFHFGIGRSAPQEAEDWGARLIGDLVHPAAGTGSLGFLTHVSIDEASLAVDDRVLGVVWHASDVNLSLARSPDSSSGDFTIASGAAHFNGHYVYTEADNRLVVRLQFAGLRPALWAPAAPALAGLAVLDVPLSGAFTAVINGATLMPESAIWDVSLGAGVLRHPALAGGALTIAGARMQGGYDPGKQRLTIGLLTIDLPQGGIGVSGLVDGVGAALLSGSVPAALDARLTLAADALAVDDFAQLWPEAVASDARRWVTANLHDGRVDRFHAQLQMLVDPSAPEAVDIRQFDGGFDFSGLTVDYFHPLPAARNVAGTARFDRTEIAFTAASGAAAGITVSAAKAGFYHLDTHDQDAKIEVAAAGPLADALAILDTPPLSLVQSMGLDPKHAAGKVAAQLDLAFPLVGDLKSSQIVYSATAKLSGIGIGGVLFGRDLSEGHLNLTLDRTIAEARGTANLAGVPVNLTWREALSGKAPRTRYEIAARLDDAQRRALGFAALDPYLQGPVSVKARYTMGPGKRGELAAAIDLAASAAAIPPLGWRKRPGLAASAQFTLDLDGDRAMGLRNATLTGSGMDAALSARFGVSRKEIEIERLVTGSTALHGEATIDESGGWTLAASGKSFDATALMKSLDQPGSAEPPPFSIKAAFDRLILGPGRAANHVAATLVSNGPHWQQVSIGAEIGNNGSLTLAFGGAAGERRFKLTTDDMGSLLRLADIYDHVQGGALDVAGEAEDHGRRRVLVLEAQGRNYRVLGAPALARLLSLASLSGIGALLNGEGIPFTALQGQVIFAGDLISLKDMRAYGGALGINASGGIDRANGTMNIAGTLAPAYTLNSVLGNIPVLGKLLVGGAGQGLFAANFRLSGPRDNPKVSVNPLSTLAPGILRNLFLFSPGGP